ncbi:peroxidase-like isoform X2 [Varroa destructor]|uniref:Peroxidase n=1 Tax=Varroa destructor TaxID=109461 RepID=A0A7M7JI95_VARDE|nr:peroxidase-like isoform X2 [Varroa destructor]
MRALFILTMCAYWTTPSWTHSDHAGLFWRPKISFPVDPTSPTIPDVHSHVIDEAVDEAQTVIVQNKLFERASLSNKAHGYPMCPAAQRHMQFRAAKSQAIHMDDMSSIFEETTKILSKKMKMFWEDEFHGLARANLAGSKLEHAAQQCHHHSNLICSDKPYRTADGSCNNLEHAEWGKSFTCLRRLLPPRYADGVSMPRISETGLQLPNPRLVSTTIHVDLDRPSRHVSHMLMQWGQFLDHDFALSPIMSHPEEIVDLGNPNDVVDCCSPNKRHDPKCFSFDIPENDKFFSKYGEHCMNFPRSARCPQCALGPRQQIDALTSFIDGSNIYGSNQEDTYRLRTLAGDGRLKFDVGQRGDMILPASFHPTRDRCSRPEEGDLCFRAGDERVNEQPGLTAMHTLWLRHHNGLADKLARLNSHWEDERIFQEASRVTTIPYLRIVIGQIQHITYQEFLPLILGDAFYREFGLETLPYGYTTYNKNIDPTILNEFAGAVFRFGHTILNGHFMEVDTHGNIKRIKLQDNFFKPFEFRHGKMERIMRGLQKQPSQVFDNFITHDVTNHLYRLSNESFGLDLIALNIQRGRDHGLRGYTDYLKGCFGIEVNTFEDLDNVMPRPVRERLESLYAHVNDIDLFTGGVSEYQLPGGVVGPTFGCIMGIQFWRLKYGDRFYYEHGGQAGSFTPSQLTQIRKITMAKIVCDNSIGQQFSQQWSLQMVSENNPEIPCESFADMDMSNWIEHSAR